MQKYKYIKSMFAISTYKVTDNQRLQILLCLNEGNLSKTDLKSGLGRAKIGRAHV